ncbi:hypothetical protein MOQ_003239 [Trypanosoma cruzi marinkellei]|uniref:non-specific serine/threonine protein kinase n=1 Tax=Trypanosoma cruzi marinkellei TaxID=85056 RepID=K2N0H9_TRYCR|nr:hypothetical protein MOQ_003239 [Trypanosoma cruzi marinkellei]
MLYDDHTCEVWLCYSSWMNDRLLCVGYYHGRVFFLGEHFHKYAKATHSINKKNGICKCFGMSAVWESGRVRVVRNPMGMEESHVVLKSLKRAIALLGTQLRRYILSKAEDPCNSLNVLIIDFVAGATLSQLMDCLSSHLPDFVTFRWGVERKWPLGKYLLRHLLRGVLKGVLQLHACGVGHGSLRPELIFVTPDLNVTLLAAEFFNSFEDLEWLRWCSPEVALTGVKGDLSGDKRRAHDIWAFGCLAFYLATYTRPFHEKDDVTSLMSELKMLHFEASTERNGLHSHEESELVGCKGHFLNLNEVEDVKLRDLIEQCTRLVCTERLDIYGVQNHPFFKEKDDERMCNFRQKEIRLFLERARHSAPLNGEKGDSLFLLNALRQEGAHEVDRYNFNGEEIDEFLLSFSVRDILIWRIALGLQRRQQNCEMADLSGHRSASPTILPKAVREGKNIAALTLLYGISTVTASVLGATFQISQDLHILLLDFLTSVNDDEDLFRILLEFARRKSLRDESLCSRSNTPSSLGMTNPFIPNGSRDTDHFLSDGTGDKGEDVHKTPVIVPFSSGENPTVQADSLVPCPSQDNAETKLVSASTEGVFSPNACLSGTSTMSNDDNENMIERNLLRDEGNMLQEPCIIAEGTYHLQSHGAESRRRLLLHRSKRLIFIFFFTVLALAVIISVIFSILLG